MTDTITVADGRTREVPGYVNADAVVGLDHEGRVVIHEGWMGEGQAFGLTLCCDAFDKGTEDGAVCRACYGEKSDDTGAYYSATGGDPWSFPGVSPAVDRP